MNANEANLRLCWLFVILVSAAWLLYMFVCYYPGVVTLDTMRQLNEGMSGVYTNWKPTLYSWQLGQLERIFPGNGIGATYTLQMFGFALAIAAISWYYTRERIHYALLVLILPMFYTVKGMLVTTVGNDEMAATCYLLFIAGILWSKMVPRAWLRRLFLVLVWGILGYGLVLRHNALPAVFVLSCWGGWRMGLHKCWKIGGWSMSFILMAQLVNAGLSYGVLQSQPSYPLRSPLVDDIVNLSILEGAWHPVVYQFDNQGLKAPHEQCIFAPESGNWNSPVNPYILYPSFEDRKRDYELLKSAWREMVVDNPQRYIITKLFFFHQFLLEGRCVPWLCDKLREAYPHIRIHMEAESRNWRAWVNREFLVMSCIPLVCYILVLGCLIGCFIRRFREKLFRNSVRVDALVFMLVAMLYTTSFILLVLSATEQRYYIIRASLCCLGGCLFLLSFMGRRERAQSADDV